MTIKTYRFKVPFKNPISMLGNLLEYREGIIFELRIKDEELRYIEISPFPGLHKESIEDVIELKDLIIESILTSSNDPAFPISVQSALNTFYKTNEIDPNIEVLTAPLVFGSRDEIVSKIETIAHQKTIKLKLGRLSIEEEIELFKLVDSKLNPEVKIRADINRHWAFDEALKFLSQINIKRIDYLEEPIDNPKKLEELHYKTGVNYALDESIYEGLNINSFHNVKALVIKPSLLSDPVDVVTRIQKNTNFEIVFSSVFETDVGFNNFLSIVQQYGNLSLAHGLDTQDNFEYKLLINNKLDESKVEEI